MSRPRSHDYAQVAEVYTEAVDASFPPTKSVQETYGLTYQAAANLVLRVRQAGHLPPTTKGRACASNRTDRPTVQGR